MLIFRGLLILVTAAAAAASLWFWVFFPEGYQTGTLLSEFAPGLLNLTQAITQRYIHPAVWTHAILPVLLTPAFAVFAVITVVAITLFFLTLLRKRRQP